MNNKITKKRLSDFLAYEWIIMLICIALVIIAWELIYTLSSVRLAKGQVFQYFYDTNISAQNDSALLELTKKDKTFSFDVLDIYGEGLLEDKNVLSIRTSTHEAKVIFSDTTTSSKEDEYKVRPANKIIDVYPTYCFEDNKGGVVYDAKNYLKGFLKEGKTDVTVYENLDEEKIKLNYNERLKGDNRYKAGELNESMEYDRIKRLCECVGFIEKVLKYDDTLTEDEKLFYSYKRFEETINTTTGAKESDYGEQTVARYGLKVNKLVGGELDSAQYFRFNDSEKTGTGDIVLILFNYTAEQKDLAYESLSFVTTIIKNFASPETLDKINGVN